MHNQTLLVISPGENQKLLEFPISGINSLGDLFPNYTPNLEFGWKGGGQVYGYILNRNSRYRAKYYGWAINRMKYPTDNVAADIRRIEGMMEYKNRLKNYQERANLTK